MEFLVQDYINEYYNTITIIIFLPDDFKNLLLYFYCYFLIS